MKILFLSFYFVMIGFNILKMCQNSLLFSYTIHNLFHTYTPPTHSNMPLHSPLWVYTSIRFTPFSIYFLPNLEVLYPTTSCTSPISIYPSPIDPASLPFAPSSSILPHIPLTFYSHPLYPYTSFISFQ